MSRRLAILLWWQLLFAAASVAVIPAAGPGNTGTHTSSSQHVHAAPFATLDTQAVIGSTSTSNSGNAGTLPGRQLAGNGHTTSHPRQFQHVQSSVAIARSMLISKGITNTSQRLALILLFSHDVTTKPFGPCLKCALESFANNILPTTPTDIFMFATAASMPDLTRLAWVRQVPNLHLLPLDESDERAWRMPNGLRPQEGPNKDGQDAHLRGWSKGQGKRPVTTGYLLMGHWRLSFSYHFVRALGYPYLLQADDDTQIGTRIPYNLVDFMRDRGLWVTNRNFFYWEAREFTVGLPELAHFWIVTRLHRMPHDQRVTPDTAAAAGIVGPLLQHCNPRDLTGLKTLTDDRSRLNRTVRPTWEGWDPSDGAIAVAQGWDNMLLAGNFNVLSLDWLFREDVQDFLQLVLRTGAHIEHRWIELAPLTIAAEMFCPSARFHVFTDLLVEHGRLPFMSGRKCSRGWANHTGLLNLTGVPLP